MKIDNPLVKKFTNKKWQIVFGVTGVLALMWLIGTAIFLFDVQDTRFVAQADGFGITHNSLSGYAVAAQLAANKTDNLYVPYHYSNVESSLSVPVPIRESIPGLFKVDQFHYPPPFLILPYGLLAIFEDFLQLRTAWFLLIVVSFIGAVTCVACWCGAFRSQNRLLVFPILLCAPTVHMALQTGNVHLLIIAISILAMIAFEEDHHIAGGALMSFAIVSKIWPAILVAHLAIQRRWKPIFWCAVTGIIYVLAGMFFFGLEPYWDYITYELPRIFSGKSFYFMSWFQKAIIRNMSIFGISHKLHALGLLSSKPTLISPVLAWTFTMFIGLIVIVTSLRRGIGTHGDDSSRLARVQLWLALLTLAQLRSPFLPWFYGVVSTLWLLVLLAGSVKGWKLFAVFVAWLGLAVNIPVTFVSERDSFNLGYTLLTSLFIYGAIIAGIKEFWNRSHGLQQ